MVDRNAPTPRQSSTIAIAAELRKLALPLLAKTRELNLRCREAELVCSGAGGVKLEQLDSRRASQLRYVRSLLDSYISAISRWEQDNATILRMAKDKRELEALDAYARELCVVLPP